MNRRVYYHATWTENLEDILTRGLILGERTGDSFYEGRTVRRICLLDEPDLSGFYGDVILRVVIPPGVRVKETIFSEGFYVTKSIPPKYITVYKRL